MTGIWRGYNRYRYPVLAICTQVSRHPYDITWGEMQRYYDAFSLKWSCWVKKKIHSYQVTLYIEMNAQSSDNECTHFRDRHSTYSCSPKMRQTTEDISPFKNWFISWFSQVCPLSPGKMTMRSKLFAPEDYTFKECHKPKVIIETSF